MINEEKKVDEGRRDFLRKSAYAAYATPVIMAMLVEKASAGKSWNHGGVHGNIPHNMNPPPKAPVGPNPDPNPPKFTTGTFGR